MKLNELSYDQRLELKQAFLCEYLGGWGEEPSWEELANADKYVTDELLEEFYGDISFTDGDFSCTENT